jgi:hypothetical protein
MVRPQFHFVENAASDQASRLQAQSQNTTRRATAEATFEARGVGTRQIKKPIIFSVTFSEEPHFVSGCATVVNADNSQYFDPIGHCGIYQWKINDKGQYTGAYLWVSVQVIAKTVALPNLSAQPTTLTREQVLQNLSDRLNAQAKAAKALAKTRTMMYLTFTGRAVKDIGQPEKAATVTPRKPPGFNFANAENN